MLAGFQRTTLYISIKLHARLRNHAHAANTSMSKLVERYCWDGLVHDELAARNAETRGRAPTSPDTRPPESTG